MELLELLVKYGFTEIKAEEWEGHTKGSKPDYFLKTSQGEMYYAQGEWVADKGLYIYSGLGSPEDYGYKIPTDNLVDIDSLLDILTRK